MALRTATLLITMATTRRNVIAALAYGTHREPVHSLSVISHAATPTASAMCHNAPLSMSIFVGVGMSCDDMDDMKVRQNVRNNHKYPSDAARHESNRTLAAHR